MNTPNIEIIINIDEINCSCGNPEYGFYCVCAHVKNNPGEIDFNCAFCGLYTAAKPRCNKCERA